MKFDELDANALNAHCYWLLRKLGRDVAEATAFLRGRGKADKNELLFQHGVNFNEVPNWQKRGVGLYWESFERDAVDPRTGEAARATRRRIKRDIELPMGDAYGEFVAQVVAGAAASKTGP